MIEIQPTGPGLPNWSDDDIWTTVDVSREIESVVGAMLGPADACCGLITFTDGTFEVGVGNPARPYLRLYKGKDLERASAAWLRWCREFA